MSIETKLAALGRVLTLRDGIRPLLLIRTGFRRSLSLSILYRTLRILLFIIVALLWSFRGSWARALGTSEILEAFEGSGSSGSA